jgi:hypothetical protein
MNQFTRVNRLLAVKDKAVKQSTKLIISLHSNDISHETYCFIDKIPTRLAAGGEPVAVKRGAITFNALPGNGSLNTPL